MVIQNGQVYATVVLVLARAALSLHRTMCLVARVAFLVLIICSCMFRKQMLDYETQIRSGVSNEIAKLYKFKDI